MPTPTNKKSAEAFVAALLQQQNFEGLVDGVGYVKCQRNNAWVAPMSPSPGIPKGKVLPTQKYTVSIERLDKNKHNDVPYFKKRFPELTNDALARAITTSSGSNKEVQIGRELYYELLPSQDVKVDINFTTGDVTLRLPNSQESKGKDYPLYVRSKNGVYSLDRDKRVNTVKLNDIQEGLLGSAARRLLIGDQEIKSSPYQVKLDYWDMLQNFGEYRPYLIGNKFTISFVAEGTLVAGLGGSLDLTWLFDGKDRSIYPYFTTTGYGYVTSGGGASFSVALGSGMFGGNIKNLDRQSLSGPSGGVEFSGIYGAGGGVGAARSAFVPDSIVWNSGYISIGVGGDASPVSGVSLKTFVSLTSNALHLSPESIIKQIKN